VKTASHSQKEGSNTKINVTDRSTNDRIKKTRANRGLVHKKIGNTVFLGKNCTRGESSKEGKRIGKTTMNFICKQIYGSIWGGW